MMKKTIFILVAIMLMACPAWAVDQRDSMHFIGPVTIGAYTLPLVDGTAAQTLQTDGSGTVSWGAAGAATAWDDIGDPDAAGTVAFTIFQQILTSTDVLTDNINIQGLGAFGDVSVVRIEQKTGNATDGTVLEVVAADANVDPLVISSSALANALVVGQNAGATTVNGALSVNGTATIGDDGDTVAINSSDWDISTTGAASNMASIGYDNGSTTRTIDVTLDAADIQALRASPYELIPATASTINEFVSAVLIINYGSEVMTESADNMVIEYEDGRDISAAIEATGLIDQNVDQVAIINQDDVPTMTAAAAVNKAIQLFNTGDGEYGGNASADTTWTIKVTYRTHTVSL